MHSSIFNQSKKKYKELGFYDRVLYQFTIILSFFVGLFIPIRIVRNEIDMVIIDAIVVLLMIVVNLCLINKHEKIAKRLMMVSIFGVLIATTATKGADLICWAYPAAAILFFTAKPRVALIANTSLCLIMTAQLYNQVTMTSLIYFTTSLQCSVFIIYVFCSKVKHQISQLEALNLEASIDPLSELGNRRLFDIDMKKLANSVPTLTNKLYLMLIDIDNFKAINDEYGHNIGDRVLRHHSELLANNIRSNDRAYRYGGEEFTVILNAKNDAQALKLSERMRELIALTPYIDETDKINIKLTSSFGLAKFKPDTTEWFNDADKALYKAKKKGRNTSVLSSSSA